MRKLILFVFVNIVVVTIFAQERRVHPLPANVPDRLDLYYQQNIGGNRGVYEAVRIGEHYWITRNLSHQKSHLMPGPWTEVREVDFPTKNQINTYLDHLKLDKTQFAHVSMDDFTYYYGAYYNGRSIRSFYNSNSGELTGSIAEEFNNWLYADNRWTTRVPPEVDPSLQWNLPSNDEFRQLFAMVPLLGLEEGTRINRALSVYDVRINLAPVYGSNPLAFDIAPDHREWNKTYWFEQGKGLYNFNMMPSGGRVDYYKELSFPSNPDLGSWTLGYGDFYQLFYVAKFATRDGSLDIEDFIHFYPNKRESVGLDYGTWYTVRLQKPLKVEELGYRLFYNNSETDPDIIEYWWDDYNNNLTDANILSRVPAGYTELPTGYLRGFYIKYWLNNLSPKFSLRELIQLSKCVEEYDADPDCDCRQGLIPEILDHINISGSDGSRKVEQDKYFTVYAYSTAPELLKFKLIEYKQNLNLPVKSWNLESSRIPGTYRYNVKIPASYTDIISNYHVIQPYLTMPIETMNSQGNKQVSMADIPIHRSVSSGFNRLVDNLMLWVVASRDITGRSVGTNSIWDWNSEEVLIHHMLIITNPNVYNNWDRKFKFGDEIQIVLPHYFDVSRPFKFGLFDLSGEHVAELPITATRPGNQQFKVVIPNSGQFSYLNNGDNSLIVAAYYTDNNSILSRPHLEKLDERMKNAFVDRELIVINYDMWGWDDWSFSLNSEPVAEQPLSVSVYPNPVESTFNVSGNFSQIQKIEIYNIAGGQLVKTVYNTGHVNISGLVPGVYTVKVTTDKGVASAKVYKK